MKLSINIDKLKPKNKHKAYHNLVCTDISLEAPNWMFTRKERTELLKRKIKLERGMSLEIGNNPYAIY